MLGLISLDIQSPSSSQTRWGSVWVQVSPKSRASGDVNGIQIPPSKNVWMYMGGGFKYFLFSSLFGEDSHFD